MKPLSKLSFITLCFLLIGSSMSYGQVKISEKVEINSSDKNVLRGVNEDYPPILINLNSPSQTNITVAGPGGGAEGSGEPGEVVVLEVPAANGTYHVTVYVLVGAGGTSLASYWADWNGQSIGNGSHYVSNAGGESDDYVPTTFSFTFGSIPELNDFSIFFLDDEVCGTSSTGLRTTTSGIETGGISLNISLQGDSIGAVIYDNSTHTSLGTSTTTTFGEVRNLSVKIDSLYTGDENKTVVLTGEAEGMTRTDELTVKSAKQYADFMIEPWPLEIPETYKGYTVVPYAYTYRGGGCGISYEDLPDDIKYNFVISQGQAHGYFAYQPDGDKVTQRDTELYNLDHYQGSLSVLYQSYASTTWSTDTVVVNISTTDPDIEPVDIEYHFLPNPVYAYPDPGTVAKGDTSQIIIKHLTSAGEVADFPEDQLYYIEIWDGYDYGTLYSSAEGYTNYYFEDVPGNFSFIAADEIDTDSVSVWMWVWVYVEDEGGTSAQNLSVKGNSISRRESFEKARNELIEKRKLRDRLRERRDNPSLKQLNKGSAVMASGEWYYSEFEIIVTKEKKEEFYVKAEFESDPLSPGDTVNVIVKKVDKDGNEYNFDPSTTFEVGLKYGCGWSYILNAAGEQEDYFASMQAPIKLIINEPPSDIDTLISLRVGVPSTADTTYKPYDELLSQQLNITEGENTKQKKQTSREVTSDLYCSVPDFLYPGYGMAEGIVEDECEEPIVECTDFEPQKISEESDEFKVLKINSRWEWKDSLDNENYLFIDTYYCIYHHPGSGGLTTVLIDTIKSLNTIYVTLSDIIINACLTKNEVSNKNKWNFNLENIRIPIFSDVCGIPAERDLIDSLRTDIWKEKIHSYNDYLDVMAGIDYEIIGSYSQFSAYPSNFVFSAGIMAHENEHVKQKKKYITIEMNKAFAKIKELEILQEIFKCPEDAIEGNKDILKRRIRNAIFLGSIVKERMGYTEIFPPIGVNADPKIVPNSELESDKASRQFYKNIKVKFNDWAQDQTWWK
ncbi:hypothetical protein ACFLTH_10160 [Bacteroidota bacterium]